MRRSYRGPRGPSGALVSSIAELKALIDRPSVVTVEGWDGPDGATGSTLYYRWEAGSTTTTSDPLVISPTAGPSGRYKLVFDGPLSVTKFGAKGTGTVDDQPAFQRAADWARSGTGRVLFIPNPANYYRLDAPVDFSATAASDGKVTILGESMDSTQLRGNFSRSAGRALFLFGNRAGTSRQATFELYDLWWRHNNATSTATPLFIDGFGAGQVKMFNLKFSGGTGGLMRLTSMQNFRGGGWVNFGPIGTSFPYKDLAGPRRKSGTVTITNANPGVVSFVDGEGSPIAHGLLDGDQIRIRTTGAISGITASTTYWIVNSTTNTFQLSATEGGSAIDTSGSQSGVHTAYHAYCFFDLSGSTATASRAIFDSGFVTRHITFVGTNETRYHATVNSIGGGDTTASLSSTLSSPVKDTWGVVEGARLTMAEGSDVATIDGLPLVSGMIEGLRIWVEDGKATKRKKPATILEWISDTQMRLDFSAPTGGLANKFFSHVLIEFDGDDALPAYNPSGPSVDFKMDGLLMKDYAGVAVAIQDMKQAVFTGFKIEGNGSPSVGQMPNGAFWLDNVNGIFDHGDLSGPHYGPERIDVSGQTSAVVFPNLTTRIGYFEREFRVREFTDAAGSVIVGTLQSLGRDAAGTWPARDDNSGGRFYFGGQFEDGSNSLPRRFYLGNPNSYVLVDGTVVSKNALLSWNSAAVTPPTAQAGALLRLLGQDSEAAGIQLDAFANQAVIYAERANGTMASRTALSNSNVILAIQGRGHTGSGYSNPRVSIRFLTAQNWTGSNQGTEGELRATPINSSTEAISAGWNGDGLYVASGKKLKLGNTYAVGSITPTGTLELTDAAGNTYLVAVQLKP